MKNNDDRRLTDKELDRRMCNFIRDLTKISRKHQIAVSTCGGVWMSYIEKHKYFDELTYTHDLNDGDITPILPDEEETQP